MGVSQPARFGEDWSDERVRGYLDRAPAPGENADFHALVTAYKHMRPHDFERFVHFFQAAGREINARNAQGQTLLDIVRSHPRSADFVAILEAAQSH
ncbi:MAG TPA: PA4642 family protein [Moraxellaceae bacterium]|nr:PA4642 family protein [Moraxellaceae bacterium]